jgi:hypothetical protein
VFHVCSGRQVRRTRAVSTLFPLFPVFPVLEQYGSAQGTASIGITAGNPEHWELEVGCALF